MIKNSDNKKRNTGLAYKLKIFRPMGTHLFGLNIKQKIKKKQNYYMVFIKRKKEKTAQKLLKNLLID